MKILVIGGTEHVGRLVVADVGARGLDVRVYAHQRPWPDTLPGTIKLANRRDLVQSEISPEVIDLNVRFLMRSRKGVHRADLAELGRCRDRHGPPTVCPEYVVPKPALVHK